MKKKIFQISFLLALLILIGYISLILSNRKLNHIKLKMVKLNTSEICCLESTVEDKSYLLKLDTGLTGYISLQKNSIINLKNRKLCGEDQWIDIHGNRYTSTQYLIPKVKIGKFLEYSETTVQEVNDEFIKKYSYINPASENNNPKYKEFIDKEIGSIGLKCIRLMDLLLIDYNDYAFYPIKQLDVFFNEKNLSYEDFVACEMNSNDKFIYLDIETEFGIKTFILDTGAGLTIFNLFNNEQKPHQKIRSSRFAINGFDYGPIDICLFPIPSQLECDGILGLDFLKKGPFILDFENNIVYFSKSEVNSLKLKD